jgi:hypothetical protein
VKKWLLLMTISSNASLAYSLLKGWIKLKNSMLLACSLIKK